MRILITSNNERHLAAALGEANGLARKNTATVANVFAVAERAELQLDIDELPKTRRLGAEAVWHGSGPWARAYGYKMTRTKLTIRRGVKGWYLVGAERISLYPGESECFYVLISAAQRDWIIQHVLTPYAVRSPAAGPTMTPAA